MTMETLFFLINFFLFYLILRMNPSSLSLLAPRTPTPLSTQYPPPTPHGKWCLPGGIIKICQLIWSRLQALTPASRLREYLSMGNVLPKSFRAPGIHPGSTIRGPVDCWGLLIEAHVQGVWVGPMLVSQLSVHELPLVQVSFLCGFL